MIKLLFQERPAVFPLRVREVVANAGAQGVPDQYQVIDAEGNAVTMADAFRDRDTAETIVDVLNAARAAATEMKDEGLQRRDTMLAFGRATGAVIGWTP